MSNTDAENFTFEALESAIEQMKREAKRPYRIVYIGPPYEGDYPPDNWPGWWCPQREYTDTEVAR